MTKKKICWVTATYFLDVDLPIVPILKKDLNIDWYIITNSKMRDSDFAYIRSKTDIPFSTFVSDCRFFSPRLYRFYQNFVKCIKEGNYDWYYFDISDYFFLFPLIKKYLGIDNITIATHNVSVPKGARFSVLAKFSMYNILRTFKNFQVFSNNQQDAIKKRTKEADIFYCPLITKDYGATEWIKEDGKTRFLFFGNIIPYKRLDLLLNACNLLVDRGYKNFSIDIAGYCRRDLWGKKYMPLIKYPEYVNTDIRRIPNELVSGLFGKNDFFVMPYQDIAQSGAMTVALNYNMPIIASNLDTFKEFLTHKQNSFLFESGDVNGLVEAMEWAINIKDEDYCKLKSNLKKMVEDNLSEQKIIDKYRQYFEKKINA